jgi:hypothetical protein
LKRVAELFSFRVWNFLVVAATMSGLTEAVCNDGPELLERLEGRSYYDMTPTSCRANAPGRALLKSWTNRIQFYERKVLIWGKICNDSPQVEQFQPDKFDFDQDLSSLIYESEQFQFFSQPPDLCEGGQWCPEEEQR